MDTVGLIVRGVIALVIIGAIYAVVNSVNSALSEHYVAPVRVEYEKKLKAEQMRAETAEAANTQLKSQLEGVKKSVSACNDNVKALKDDEKVRTSASDKMLKDQQANARTVYDDMIERLAAAAHQQTPGGFCEQAKKADDTLSTIGDRQRMRDATRKAKPGR